MTRRDSSTGGQDLRRTAALRETIGAQTARLCFETHGESLRAVILTGSLARDEATLIEEKKSWRLLGDAEFLLIFHSRASLPPKAAMGFLRQNIETSISRLGIVGEVSLSAAHPRYLSTLRPHIFAYELRNCGQVLWGEREILTRIPNFSASDIPLEDGWRLLSNRMVEQLDALEELEQRPKILPRRLFYCTIKLYLDMATSYMLFSGAYVATYAERARRLRLLADTQPADGEAPFDLGRFSDRVSECTQWKLLGSDLNSFSSSVPVSELGWPWWEEAVEHAQQLWRWELTQLIRREGGVATEPLLQRWMRCQPLARRLRGWLYVVRDRGWHRSWKNWLRWARLVWRGSPRDWIYAGASQLFFQLPNPSGLDGHASQVRGHSETVLRNLPVITCVKSDPGPSSTNNWLQVAPVVVWNYRQFLEKTRS